MHPSLNLLFLVILAIHISLPAAAWLLLWGKTDRNANLWFSGISIYAAGVLVLLALGGQIRPAAQIGSVLPTYLALVLMLEALWREASGRRPGWRTYTVVGVLFGSAYSLLSLSGHGYTHGALLASVVIGTLEAVMTGVALYIAHTQKTRSLRVVAAGVALALSGQLLRIWVLLFGQGSFKLLDFSPASNYLVIASIIAMIFSTFGYWGFVLEKIQQQELRASAAQQAAEAMASEMRQLLDERNHMLMLNSRFSTLENLSSFSASLVHEISQPLQAIELSLHNLRNAGERLRAPADTLAEIDNLQQLSQRAAKVVAMLRQMMSTGDLDNSRLDLRQSLASILPVLQAEASNRRVPLSYTDAGRAAAVLSNEVMLQRVVLNLVTNALDAVQGQTQPTPAIQVTLSVAPDDSQAVILIRDNGPGMDPQLLARLFQPFQSTKHDGLGIGLSLSHKLVAHWRGQLQVSSPVEGDQMRMPAALTNCAAALVSSVRYFSNAACGMGMGEAPSFSKRSRTSAMPKTCITPACTLSTMGLGVLAVTNSPTQKLYAALP
jgi:signal transduction histidine kinase